MRNYDVNDNDDSLSSSIVCGKFEARAPLSEFYAMMWRFYLFLLLRAPVSAALYPCLGALLALYVMHLIVQFVLLVRLHFVLVLAVSQINWIG